MDDAEPIKQGGTAEAEPLVPGGRKARAVSGNQRSAASNQPFAGRRSSERRATRCLARCRHSSIQAGCRADAQSGPSPRIQHPSPPSDIFSGRPGMVPEAARCPSNPSPEN
jgi:hypothetical protein